MAPGEILFLNYIPACFYIFLNICVADTLYLLS